MQRPYPVPEHLSPNRRHAAMLIGSYSGRVSELTAINQYVYHHLALERTHPDIAHALRDIAVQEMHHLDMLGSCIRDLGMRPKFVHFAGRSQRFWSAGFVVYGKTPREMLEADKRAEYAAIAQYERLVRQLGDSRIEALLKRMIEDEYEHIAILDHLLQHVK